MLLSSQFRTGPIPSVEECHARNIVAIGEMKGLTYEQALACRTEACARLLDNDVDIEHLTPFVSWLKTGERLEKKRKADADAFLDDPNAGTTLLTVGQYKGETYGDVYDKFKSYCSRIVSMYDDKATTDSLRYFIEYVKMRGVPEAEEEKEKSMEELDSTVIDFGRVHRGKTFKTVLETDLRYCQWVVGEDDVKGRTMKLFAGYLKKAGVEATAKNDVESRSEQEKKSA